MTRSTHRKSRKGCRECKTRHVKCDESRPTCINCKATNRHCPYLDENKTEVGSSTVSLKDSPSSDVATDPSLIIRLPPPGKLSHLVHLELLNQWFSHTQEIFCPKKRLADEFSPITMDYALAFPFLMKAFLSMAAIHLSLTKPEKRDFYRGHAERLHEEALAGFNTIVSSLNAQNVLPALVFSTVIGMYHFCHTFSFRDVGLSGFLEKLIECMVTLRGNQMVLAGWWDFFKSSELGFMIQGVDRLSDEELDKNTDDLDDLRRLILSTDFDSSTTPVYAEALRGLQKSYNSDRNDNQNASTQNSTFALIWLMTVSKEFRELLAARQPEALIIIAYLAPMLHHRRDYWAIGDAGEYLISSISNYLGQEWQHWLDKPRALMLANTSSG